LQVINEKMEKRTDPWQGRLMSSGGRLIFTNSCLGSIPTYMMGFYHLTHGQHEEFDTIRGRFFWQGGSKTFRYHMAKWESIPVPKGFGGLGLINTRRMNDCLLAKWTWKIMQKEKIIMV
jgi:hypothetical protein